jgi:hypothetical protein
MSKSADLEVLVKWNGKETKFTGSVEEVSSAFLDFLCEKFPKLEMISKIVLTVDLEEVIRSLQDISVIAKEGVMVLPNIKPKASDAIILNLVGQYVGFKMSLIEKDTLDSTEIEKATGEKRGTVTGRLSELVSKRIVENPEKGKYRITSLGIKYFLEETVNKLRQVKK